MRKKNLPSDNERIDIYYGRKSSGNKIIEEANPNHRFNKQARSLKRQSDTFDEFYINLAPEEKTHKLNKIEEAMSAYVPGKREGYNQIISTAEAKGINILYVDETKRIARNHQESGKIAQLLADGKINKIITMDGKTYTRKDSGQLILFTIEGGFAWKESADKGWFVSQGMQNKAMEGGSTGRASLGFKNVGDLDRKWIEIDENLRSMILHLFTLASAGNYSLHDLEKACENIGLRSRPTRRHPKGCKLSASTIQHMLRDPAYKGYKRYKGEIIKAQHDAIVSVEVWEKAQIHLTERRTYSTRTKDSSLRDLFIMAGVVRCGECSHHLAFYKAKDKYIIGECKNRNTKCKNCINQEKLLPQFYERLELLSLEDGVDKLMRKELKEIHEQKNINEQKEHQKLNKEYENIQREIGDLFTQRGEAERLGVLDAVDSKLATLKMRKDELWKAMENTKSEGSEWIDHVIRSFELAKLAQEAIKYGSPQVRQGILKSLGSNYTVIDGKLVWDWNTPFREMSTVGDNQTWLPRSDSN